MENVSLTQHSIKNSIASKPNVDLFILPVLSPVGYCEGAFQEYLLKTAKIQHLCLHNSTKPLASIAKKLHTFISYGRIDWIKETKWLDRSGTLLVTNSIIHFVQLKRPRCYSLLSKKVLKTRRRSSLLLGADMRYHCFCRRLVCNGKTDVLLQSVAFLEMSSLSL